MVWAGAEASDPVAGVDLRARLAALAPFDGQLKVPDPRPGLVARPRLVARLSEGATPVVVLSAATGYGKTTLLAEWAAADPRPFAWVSLTEVENDPFALVAYVARALDGVEALDEPTLSGLTRSQADLATTLLPSLGRALQQRDAPVVLVLDDVHLLDDPACAAVLTMLADHVGSGSQLALSGRIDPRLLVSRLRAQGRLLRLTDDDLGLTASEGGALVRAAGLELDADALADLVERADGWPAGLYLATIAVRGGRDLDRSARAFRGDDRVVAALLHDEVLPSLPPSTVQFLMGTSVLDRFSASLCDAVLERDDSADALDELRRSNLFLVPLDRSGQWFRYHRLFRDLLRSELARAEPEAVPAMHARASAWFESDGDVEAAVRHAVAAGEGARAGELIWKAAPRYLASGQSVVLRRWLEWFPPDDLLADPHLAMSAAWAAVSSRDVLQTEFWVEAAERGPVGRTLVDGRSVPGLAALLRSWIGRDGLTATRRDAALAYELDLEGSPFRPLARYLEGAASRLLGEDAVAREQLEEAVRSSGPTLPPVTSQALAQLALLDLDDDWTVAAGHVDRARGIARQLDLREHPAQVMVYALSALALARRGETTDARRDALHARGLLGNLGELVRFLAVDARLVLAQASMLLGDVSHARLLLQEAESALDRFPDPGILPDRLRHVRKGIDDVHLPAGVVAAPLTTAELRVLRYLPTHLTLAAIAEELYVSRNTAKTHAISVYRKLGVTSRQAAVQQARGLGLLDDDR